MEQSSPAYSFLDALNVLNTPLCSVPRASGGLSAAESCQIAFLEKQGIEVKVRFKEFDGKEGELASGKIRTFTKTIKRSDLLAPFSFELTEEPFLLDFGRGIVPIRVISFEREKANVTAYFLEEEDWTALLSGNAAPILIYAVDRLVLRRAKDSLEIRHALENYYVQKTQGGPVIPPALLWGAYDKVTLPLRSYEIREIVGEHVHVKLLQEKYQVEFTGETTIPYPLEPTPNKQRRWPSTQNAEETGSP